VTVGVVVVAAPLEAAPKTVAPTAPPASSEPAMAAVVMPLRIGFMSILSFTHQHSLVRRRGDSVAALPHSSV
jgi:hypothetical protein